ncbi:MAG: polymerase sigma-B factor [Solirubrobacteraceae bacterium]|nr:polymerase sigma-B factor [Solirubrobacteraceae bacterium]
MSPPTPLAEARTPGSLAGPPPVSREERELEVRDLFLRYRAGDQAARDALVARFLPLARQLAGRYRRTGEVLDDLQQVASLGLVKAVDRFDPSREIAFTSYAVPTILGELKRYLRDTGWAVHVPRSLQERSARVESTIGELRMTLGRSPSTAEIAAAAALPSELVIEAMTAPLSSRTLSLDAPHPGAGEDALTFGDSLGIDDERLAGVDDGAALAAALGCLHHRERTVLHLRFAEDLTQTEIGERVGISQMHVSRVLRRALARLRDHLEACA